MTTFAPEPRPEKPPKGSNPPPDVLTLQVKNPRPAGGGNGGNPPRDILSQEGPELTGFFKPDKPKSRPTRPRPPPNTPEVTDFDVEISELQVKNLRPGPAGGGGNGNTPPDILSKDGSEIVEFQVKNPRPAGGGGGNGGNPPPDILALDGFKPRYPSPDPFPGPRPKPGPTKPMPDQVPRLCAVEETGSGKPKGDPIPQGPVGPGRPEVEAVAEVVVGA